MFSVMVQLGSFKVSFYGPFASTAFLAGIFCATSRAWQTGRRVSPFSEMGSYGGEAFFPAQSLSMALLLPSAFLLRILKQKAQGGVP